MQPQTTSMTTTTSQQVERGWSLLWQPSTIMDDGIALPGALFCFIVEMYHLDRVDAIALANHL